MRVFNQNLVLIFSIATIFHSPSHGQTSKGLLDIADRMPHSTLILFECNDCSQFLRALSRTGLGKAFLDLPSAKLSNDGFSLLSDEPMDANRDRTFLEQSLEMIDGSIFFSAIVEDQQIVWALKLDVSSQHHLFKLIREFLINEQRIGNVKFQSDVKNLAPADEGLSPLLEGSISWVFSNQKFQLFIKLDEGSLLLGSSSRFLETLLGEAIPSRTLANNRRYQEIQKVLAEEETDLPHLSFYADIGQILNMYFLSLGSEFSEFAKQTAISELTAVGGVITADENGLYELAGDFYVSHTLPVYGINNLLKLNPLRSPCHDDIPADCDFYFNGNLDLSALRDGVNELDELIDGGKRRTALRGLLNTTPILAYAFFLDEDEFEKLNGEVDATVRFISTDGVFGSRVTSRLFCSEGGEGLADNLFQRVPGFNSAFELSVANSQRYYVMTEAVHRSMIEQAEAKAEEGTPKINYRRDAFVGLPGAIVSLADASEIHSVLGLDEGPRLLENAALQAVWRSLTKNENPGFFMFVKGHGFFRYPYHWIREFHFRFTDYSTLRMTKMEEAGQTDDPEYQWWHKLVERYQNFSIAEFESQFGPGGIGVFQKNKGYLIRVRQFKPLSQD